MAKVVHFEIPTENLEASARFFKAVFQWEFEPFRDDYWIVKAGPDDEPGINGAIMKSMGKGHPVVNTILVDNLEQALIKVKENGGTIFKEAMDIPGVGQYAIFSDPDGNMHGVLQPQMNRV
ncbi:MAG: VOC family protein [Chitinophagales bacterium]